jgi:NAD(P)H-dependent flavin oxidoreductase YrpB (nitropropane dioxygenase family)
VRDPIATPVCRLLGIDLPIVQAPIGSATTPELAAAVANAGGLGMLGLTWTDEETAADRIRRTQALTSRSIGVNLVLAFPIERQLDAALSAGVRIISTCWGDPSVVRATVSEAGAIHVHTVGTADEGRRAVDAGVDVVVAQGSESGGHVSGQVATMALVPAVVDAVDPTPVIAAGGIGDGRGLAAALALGAQAVWLGTRFLTASEASSHPEYRARLIDAEGDDAVLTTCFDGGWSAPHRVLRSSVLDTWEQAGRPATPDRPDEGDIVARGGGREYQLYDDMMPLADVTGSVERMALYAGQSVGLVRDDGPAATIVERIARQARSIIEGYQDR